MHRSFKWNNRNCKGWNSRKIQVNIIRISDVGCKMNFWSRILTSQIPHTREHRPWPLPAGFLTTHSLLPACWCRKKILSFWSFAVCDELQGNHETLPKEAEGSVRYLFLTDHFLYLSLNLQNQQAVTQQPLGNTSKKRVKRVVLSQVSFHTLQINIGKTGVSSQKRQAFTFKPRLWFVVKVSSAQKFIILTSQKGANSRWGAREWNSGLLP